MPQPNLANLLIFKIGKLECVNDDVKLQEIGQYFESPEANMVSFLYASQDTVPTRDSCQNDYEFIQI